MPTRATLGVFGLFPKGENRSSRFPRTAIVRSSGAQVRVSSVFPPPWQQYSSSLIIVISFPVRPNASIQPRRARSTQPDLYTHLDKLAIEASRCNRLLCLPLPERAASDFFFDPLS